MCVSTSCHVGTGVCQQPQGLLACDNVVPVCVGISLIRVCGGHRWCDLANNVLVRYVPAHVFTVSKCDNVCASVTITASGSDSVCVSL